MQTQAEWTGYMSSYNCKSRNGNAQDRGYQPAQLHLIIFDNNSNLIVLLINKHSSDNGDIEPSSTYSNRNQLRNRNASRPSVDNNNSRHPVRARHFYHHKCSNGSSYKGVTRWRINNYKKIWRVSPASTTFSLPTLSCKPYCVSVETTFFSYRFVTLEPTSGKCLPNIHVIDISSSFNQAPHNPNLYRQPSTCSFAVSPPL